MRYISKQWSVTLRDFLKSLYYGALVPALVAIQGVIENGVADLSWQLLGKIAIGSLVAHLIRKMTEPSKVIEVTKLSEEGNPPPMGDPTHPPKKKD